MRIVLWAYILLLKLHYQDGLSILPDDKLESTSELLKIIKARTLRLIKITIFVGRACSVIGILLTTETLSQNLHLPHFSPSLSSVGTLAIRLISSRQPKRKVLQILIFEGWEVAETKTKKKVAISASRGPPLVPYPQKQTHSQGSNVKAKGQNLQMPKNFEETEIMQKKS